MLVLGGKLRASLVGQIAACAAILIAIWPTLRPAGISKLKFDWSVTKMLFRGGTAFVVSSLVMTLQPNIDELVAVPDVK